MILGGGYKIKLLPDMMRNIYFNGLNDFRNSFTHQRRVLFIFLFDHATILTSAIGGLQESAIRHLKISFSQNILMHRVCCTFADGGFPEGFLLHRAPCACGVKE